MTNSQSHIPYNEVQVQMDDDFTHYGNVKINDIYDPMFHTAVTGTVLSVCENLHCGFERYRKLYDLHEHKIISDELKQIYARSLEFMPPSIEVKKGDRILIKTTAHFANKDRGVIFIRYDDILGIFQDGDFKPINGYLFVNPKIEESKILDFTYEVKKSISVGEIIYQAPPNLGYMYYQRNDTADTKVGDKIIFKKSLYIPTNHPTHPIFSDYEQLYVIQRWCCLSKL